MRLPLRSPRRGPGPWLLGASLCGWALMVASGAGHVPVARMIALCSGAEVVWPVPGATASGHHPGAVTWLAMLLAMAPLLRIEAGHLWSASLPRRRASALAAFACAYAAPWASALSSPRGIARRCGNAA